MQNVDYRRNTGLYSRPIDKESRHLLSQLLYSYKLNPQTLLLIGYSDNYLGSHRYPLTQADRTFFVKLGYAWFG